VTAWGTLEIAIQRLIMAGERQARRRPSSLNAYCAAGGYLEKQRQQLSGDPHQRDQRGVPLPPLRLGGSK